MIKNRKPRPSARKRLFFVGVILFALVTSFSFYGVSAQEGIPTAEPSLTPIAPTPESLINAVNNLRLSRGLPPLATHPILMTIAQTEVNGILAGYGGHWRPNDITLGQWLLSLGYPLAGNLSMDGYRSENFLMGPGFTIEYAIQFWTMDDPHTNTMLSTNRSDIGAAIATGIDEWGQTVYYYVIETALQMSSGQMQYEASSILTAMANDQIGIYGDATKAAQALTAPQYINAVARATARPDGDVIHDVKNGQSLWSIAIEYGVTIEQIRMLNNLPSTDIYAGQKLVVAKGATQPVPTAVQTQIADPPTALATPSIIPFQTAASEAGMEEIMPDNHSNSLSLVVVTMAGLVLGGVFITMGRKKPGTGV
jgi:LysM repeat protein/uncharacterized protein YkwD